MSRFVKTHVDDLRLGMFVADLDCPWGETPFLLQGFTISTQEELATLRELCTIVDVDIGKTRFMGEVSRRAPSESVKRSRAASRIFEGKSLLTYSDSTSFEDEIGNAEKVFNDYAIVVGDLYKDVAKHGTIDMPSVKKTVDEVVGSIMRNTDACMLLSAIRNKDSYSYSHAMASSILAAAMGRQVGLPLQEVKALAQGSVLCDVGKLEIPSEILNKATPLSDEEMGIVRGHVQAGLALLERTSDVSPEILSIVANHHERHNGSGYPRGLAGAQIPPMSRVAGIVDTYDAMISDRVYARGIPPAEVISKLYMMRGVEFQSELVEEFIQTVGIYPVGSFVQLSDGRIGVVVTEHRRRRLRPRLLVIMDDKLQTVETGTYVNLLEEETDEMGRPLEILKGVEPLDFGIDPAELVF